MSDAPSSRDRADQPRDRVDPSLCWDLSVVYPDAGAWEAEKTALIEEIPRLDRFRGRLADPAVLAEALDAVTEAHKRLERLGHYASRRRDEDLGLSAPAAMTDQVTRLGAELRAATAYFDPEVLAVDEARLREWMAEPRFRDYDRYLHDLLRQKPHVLGPAEEKILANASVFSPVPYHTYSTFADAELKRPPVTLEDGLINTRVLCAADESARTGQPVTLT